MDNIEKNISKKNKSGEEFLVKQKPKFFVWIKKKLVNAPINFYRYFIRHWERKILKVILDIRIWLGLSRFVSKKSKKASVVILGLAPYSFSRVALCIRGKIQRLSKKVSQHLNDKSEKQNFIIKKKKFSLSYNPFFVAQGMAVFGLTLCLLFLGLHLVELRKIKISENSFLQTAKIYPASPVVAGQSVKWVAVVDKQDITSNQYLLKLPKQATNIKVKTLSYTDTTRYLASIQDNKQTPLTDQKRMQLAGIFNWKNPLLADLEEIASNVVEAVAETASDAVSAVVATIQEVTGQVQETEDAKVVDLSPEAPKAVEAPEVVETPEVAPAPAEEPTIEATPVDKKADKEEKKQEKEKKKDKAEPTPEPTESLRAPSSQETPVVADLPALATPEALQADLPITDTTDQPDIVDTVSPSDLPALATPEALQADLPDIIDTVSPSDQEIVETPEETDKVLVEFETPGAQITEQDTNTGKLVTIFDPTTDPAQPQLTDVLAFTTIPEIYKVGQENRIKIKWQNNGNQEMQFNAFDLDNNGKIDYVEWTVPHLSEQIFEIIFISKAFRLDANKEILEDIYEYVHLKDNNWVTIENGQYIRVTFEKILDNTKDITIYAKSSAGATIEVYAENTGQLITTFENISEEKTYKVLLTNLQSPTDVFDLKITGGSIDFDYIVDPSSQEILRPNAAGDLTQFTIRSGCTSNFECVDEEVADGDNTYVNSGQPDFGGYPTFYIAIKENSVTTTVEKTLTDSYAEYSNQWDTRPSNSGSWTITDINALQIGVKAVGDVTQLDLYNLPDSSIPAGSTINSVTVYVNAKNVEGGMEVGHARVTQVYVVVDYTPVTSQEILRPNGAGSETAFMQYPAGGSNFDKVDEEIADDNSTYVYTASGWQRDLYALSNHTGSGTINSVTVYARLKSEVTGNYGKISIRTNGTTYDTSAYALTTSWATESNAWATNPQTTDAWTWDEIDALEVGISLYGESGGPAPPSILKGRKVLMADGSQKNIEDVQVGDEIISFNLDSWTVEKDKVTAVRQGNHHDDYLVFNNVLEASLDHKIWTNGEFIEAKDIKIGDFLLNSDGQEVEVTEIEYIQENVETYDLSVEKNHNFFAENYLVHNAFATYATQVYAVVDYTPAASDPADSYWVGGTGNWSDAATHWAASSGGAAGAGNLPGATTNVHFDSNSGGGTATVDGAVSVATVVMDTNNTTAVTLGNTLATTGNFTVTAGTFDPVTYLTTIGGTFSVTGTIKVGASTFAGNYSATPTLNTGSTVNYALGDTQTIANYTYSNLTTSGGAGTKSLSAETTVNGIVTIGASTTLSASGSNYNMIVGGDWTNSGTFTAGTGTVTFNGSSTQTINSGASSFYNVTLTNNTFTLLTNAMTVAGNLVISEAKTPTITATTSEAFTVTGTTDGTNGGAVETLTVNTAGAVTFTGAVGTGDADMLTALTITNSAALLFSSTINITGALTQTNAATGTTTFSNTVAVNSATLRGVAYAVNNSFTTTGALAITNSGIFTKGATGAVVAPGGFSTSGAATLSNNITTTNTALTITGALIVGTGRTITLSTQGAVGVGNITFSSTVNGVAGGAAENLTVNAGTGTVTFTGIVGGSAALGAMTLTGGAFTVSAAVTTTGAIAVTNSGVFTKSATGAIVAPGGFSTSGAATLSNNITTTNTALTIGGNLIIGDTKSVTLAAGSGAITITGTTDGVTGSTAETLIANTTGAITFTGVVGTGDSTGLTTLTITNSAALLFSSTINITGAFTQTNAATGTTTFSNTVAVASATLKGVAFAVNNSFTAAAAGAVAVTNSGIFTKGATGAIVAPGGFSTSGAATLSNNITTTNTALSIGGNLILSEAATPILVAGSGAITVTGTTDGTTGGSAETLTVNTTGAITFTGVVGTGDSTGLTTLTITNSVALLFSGLSTEILRPNGAGDSTEFTKSGCAANYGCINETVTDGDTTYVASDFVIGGSSFYIAIKEKNGVTTTVTKTLTTSYAEYSNQWDTRPSDSGSWTIDDINALQIGVKAISFEEGTPKLDLYNLPDSSIPDGSTINSVTVYVNAKRVNVVTMSSVFPTQVYVEVDYTPPASSAINITGAFTQTNPATGITTFTGAVSVGSATLRGTTINLGGTTTINGNLNIAVGTLAAGANAVNVAGNWTNSGTFTSSGTVTLNGTSQKIFGATTFYNLIKDISAGSADTLLFQQSNTQSIADNGTLTLTGASGKVLTLRGCDGAGTQTSGDPKWGLNVGSTGTTLSVDYVDVKDSDASAGKAIAQTNSTDSGNNSNWSFDSTPPVQSNWSPATGSTITDSTPTITLTLDENGDCRLSLLDDSYDLASDDTDCTGDGTTSISCTAPDLGVDGLKTVYIACQDAYSNKDTSATNTALTYTLDTTAPTLAEVTAIPDPTTDPTPSYTFSSNDTGTITYGGDCSSATTTATSGNNTITFSRLSNGTYSNCTITVTDTAGNPSSALSVSTFRVGLTGAGAVANNFIVTVQNTAEQVASIPKQVIEQIQQIPEAIVNQVNNIAQQISQISQLVTDIFSNQPQSETFYLPIEEAVPEDAPESLQRKWDLIQAKRFMEISILPLPDSIKKLALDFPIFQETLEKIGIGKPEDVGKLRVARLSFPGLAETIGVKPGTVSLKNFTPEDKIKIPSNFVFAKVTEGKIDLNTKISFGANNSVTKSIKTIQNKPLYLVIKPDKPASKITGYIIYKSVVLKESARGVALNRSSVFSASLLNTLVTLENSSDEADNSQNTIQKEMLVNKFDYEDIDGDGIYMASINSPDIEGNYNIRTVVEYEDKDQESLEENMTLVVVPEGYIYENFGGRETRIKNAVVSIYWLNPEIEKYEIWPADKFMQENPQTTDKTGTYSFLVPEGWYYIEAKADGYINYKGEAFEVTEGSGIHADIELGVANWWQRIFTPERIIIIMLVAILTALLVIALTTIKKRNINYIKNAPKIK